MILFVLRKMLANKWMVASLLIGVILAVAMVATIPIYSHGILTRMLVRDLQIYQENSGVYPGTLSVSGYVTMDDTEPDRLAWYDELSALVRGEVPKGMPVPLLTESSYLQQNFLRVSRVGGEADPVSTAVGAGTGLMERLAPVIGHVPRPSSETGSPIIEAAIIRSTAAEGRLVFGETYDFMRPRELVTFGDQIRIVGVVEMADPTDVYWSFSLLRHGGVLLVNPEDLRRIVQNDNPGRNIEGSWNYTFDYQQLNSEQVAPFVGFARDYVIGARSLGLTIRIPALRIMEAYLIRERALIMTLWVLQAPLLLMLTFYLFMVSQVLIDHERNEIALMKSRGANRQQVFLTYVILGTFLSVTGFIVGPLVGLAICRILGSSSGFLEFVQRRALRVTLTPRATFYAAIAAVVSLLTILIPAVGASRTTIVHHKQRRSNRGRKRPLWRLLFLDVVLIAVSGYGLYQFYARSRILELSGLEATELALDPILLVMSTLFVIGAGLLFLRFYPALVRLLYRAGARSWSPEFFASLVQVGRNGGKDHFLMLFIILSISIGVYNADAARTLNQNVEEQLRYGIGADIVLEERWQQVDSEGSPVGDDSMSFGGGPPTGETPAAAARFVEPPFRRYEELPGVVQASPVFRSTTASGRSFAGTSFGRVDLFGIVPHEFGTTAWFRNDLLPSHWFNYLNLLSHSPAAALVSRSLAEEADLALGDPIYLRWGEQPLTLYYVYGFVDYWPGYNPYRVATSSQIQHLVVVNLSYMHATTALEPYQVWISLEDGVTSAEFYESLTAGRISPTRIADANQELIVRRNDPMLQGTNGTLSLGFLVSLGICFVGFLLYWIFSIRDRTLQFGLFRAMGMSKMSIIGMLGLEQLFVSGAAVAAGFGIGRLTSRLFVPLLQVVRSAEQTVPPFRVVSDAIDQVRIIIFVTAMLTVGFVILSVVLSRIRIHQAVKLGEE